MKYTVSWFNSLTMNSGFRGTYTSIEDAQKYANREADQSRSFVTFEVWEGTPKTASAPVPNTKVQGKQ